MTPALVLVRGEGDAMAGYFIQDPRYISCVIHVLEAHGMKAAYFCGALPRVCMNALRGTIILLSSVLILDYILCYACAHSLQKYLIDCTILPFK
jgi:hypothetical protein